MNIAVVGSRDLVDYKIVEDVLFSTVNPEGDVIVSGGAKGADQLAEHFANENSIPKIIHRPNYDEYGKAAPFVRNQLIVDDADYMVAFWDGVSKGTKDSIDKAKKKGIQVLHIQITIPKEKKRKKYVEIKGNMKVEG
jgi:hypothetical protein